jgi:PAS domain S-box-containing protein
VSADLATSRAKATREQCAGTRPETTVLELQSSEGAFQLPSFLNQLNDVILLTDLSGRITGCNEGVSRYGFRADELIGKNFGIFCWPDQQTFIANIAFPNAVEAGRFEAEIRSRTKTGADRQLHVCLSLLRDEKSTPASILAICIDTTDRTSTLAPSRTQQPDQESPVATFPPRHVDGVDFVVASALMQQFMGLVDRVAGHTETVLIIGETGTGKELVARSIHNASHRSKKHLIDINCAALPENLVESELFGYEKGAFSGAESSKPGLFELADKSTIFLDEIGELQPQIQVKLLRVLDGSPFYRLGGNRKIAVDVRVVAATNRDLEAAVKEGHFRKDLYHRLSQFQLQVPPLRERPEDVAALAQHFLALKSRDTRFSEEALACLQSHPWPGNVRELRSVVAKLVMASRGGDISLKDVLRELSVASPAPIVTEMPADLESMEEQMIVRALESTAGHRAQAAQKLGISRRTLSRKLREYKIDTPAGGKVRTLGTISHDQQKFFRAKVEIRVTLKNAVGDECFAIAQNLSTGGMGLDSIENPERFSGLLDISFVLPDGHEVINCKARLVWADASGKAGARFVTIDPAQFQDLQRWTNCQMEREGWELPS